MKKFAKIALWIFAALAVVLGGWYAYRGTGGEELALPLVPGQSVAEDVPDVETVAENLSIPWDIGFLPDGRMLVTERAGRMLMLDGQGGRKEIAIPGVAAHARGEGGLLGIAIHPDFGTEGFVYLYISEDRNGRIENAVWQFWFSNDALMTPAPILAGIPGAAFHGGGRIEFGPPASCQSGRPDCMLYVATGDASSASLAQDVNSLAGKILRVDARGEIPAGNPFGTSIYSYGHRNPQGLAWDSAGRLWSTEHGRSGAASGLDELNLIVPGGNYGWPAIEGDGAREGMISPAVHSGPSITWAPASALYWDGSIFFGGLRGQALYEAVLEGESVREVREHFKGEFGRIRTVRLGPDGMLYLTTSNTDGRGGGGHGDDRIIRINPRLFR